MSMLAKLKTQLQGKNAFTTAEMLLVLLIVSFLILAIPPVVHKKFEKKVTRGLHGRYECWIDPVDGNMYEYLATEKDGPVWDKKITEDSNNKPIKGRIYKNPSSARCIFDANAYAPGAAFFSVQIIGGGGGGTYPPYENTTSYSNEAEKNEQTVSISGGAYAPSLDALEKKGITWVKAFFPPALNTKGITLCSARGHGGIPIAWGKAEERYLNYTPGGLGTPGECYTADRYTLAIGSSNKISTELGQGTQSHIACASYDLKANWHQVTGSEDIPPEAQCNTSFRCSIGDCAEGDTTCNPNLISAQINYGKYPGSKNGVEEHTCSIAGGGLGYSPNTQMAEKVEAGVTNCQDPWRKTGQNYSTSTSVSPNIDSAFPTPIRLTYISRQDTTTYGYAGKSGQLASMILPKFVGSLEIELGNGGNPGTSASKQGGNGKSTIVWARKPDVSSDTKCNDSTPGCKRVLIAAGGSGIKGSATGHKMVMRGKHTCSGINGIHGCLDRGVATEIEAPLRYSSDSGFVSIPEFDKKTKTPSAIAVKYDNSTVFKPGTGGDGGYSYIYNNEGTEKLKATNHNNFSKESLNAIGQSLSGSQWTEDACTNTYGSYKRCELMRTHSDSVKEAAEDYACFQRGDSGSNGSGGTYGQTRKIDKSAWQENVPGTKSRICTPSRGYPGAVIIIW